MRVDQLLSNNPALLEGLQPEIAALDICGLASDSRKVEPGYLFAALAGSKLDGAEFIRDAFDRGAVAALLNKGIGFETNEPLIRTADPRRALALASATFAGAQPETMVAVTGTAGKTSVASFVRQIWADSGLGSAMIGTTGIVAPGRVEYRSLTTPDPIVLHQVLAELAGAGVTHASMEASSHGLDQRRLDGVQLSAAAFTNLGRDHMDYHPSVDDYFDAKMRLFDSLLPSGAPAIIFSDDPFSGRAIDVAKAAGLDVRTVGRRGDFISLKRVEHHRHKQSFELHFDGQIYEVDLPLAGEFQVFNALVAAGLALSSGVDIKQTVKALEKLQGASGRLELIGSTSDGAPAYVDYAHKPDALENVLTAVRPFTAGRIVVVFGCGGDRDAGKRPLMGEIAHRLADIVIVTDDNPRSENAADVRAQILAAAPDALEIGSRADAIEQAVGMLRKGDTLIVAGKGHEEGQIVGTSTLPFSDHAEVRKALQGGAQ